MSAFRCTECGQDNEMETARFMRKIMRKDLIKYYTNECTERGETWADFLE